MRGSRHKHRITASTPNTRNEILLPDEGAQTATSHGAGYGLKGKAKIEELAAIVEGWRACRSGASLFRTEVEDDARERRGLAPARARKGVRSPG